MGKEIANNLCSDEALKEKTGRNWAEWSTHLDAGQAQRLDYKELAKWVNSQHSAGGWWSQTIAVGYEQLRGKRALYERADGSFSCSISKTLPIHANEAHAFFVDKDKRAKWLTEDIVIRTATAPKSVRFTWPDQTSVAIWITAKGDAKCSIGLEHSKLTSKSAVPVQKAYWKSAFQKLSNIVAQALDA